MQVKRQQGRGRQQLDRRKETGRIGEEIARRFLENKGWHILDTNWTSRLGELDIIAQCEAGLVIVEVRTTRGSRFGYGFQSVGMQKQQQVRKLALQYVQSRQLFHLPLRLDVISVLLSSEDTLIRVDHIEGAF
jgi:putative endonuclease